MYEEDLAFIHDARFGEPARAAAREILDQRQGITGGALFELGCGSAIVSEVLQGHGWGVRGIDLSPDMVRLATQKVPAGTFYVADAADVQIPPCDVIVAIGEVFNHAFKDASEEALVSAFTRMYESLSDGGFLLFDVAAPGRDDDAWTSQERGKDWRVTAQTREVDGWRLRSIDAWRTLDGIERHSHELHKIRLLSPQLLESALRQAGFHVETLGGYDDYLFEVGWDAYLARK